jgi:hypothetical protein
MAERKTTKRRRLTLLDYALMAAVVLIFGVGAATALSMQPGPPAATATDSLHGA